jgi:hypothetical protein
MGGWKDTSTYSTVTAKREPQGNLIAEVRAYPHTGKITDHESVRRPASHGGFMSKIQKRCMLDYLRIQ